MAKKKRAPLPRVTVLAYNRRELVAFVQAVETFRLLVDDLRAIARDLGNVTITARRSVGKGKKAPTIGLTVTGAGGGQVAAEGEAQK